MIEQPRINQRQGFLQLAGNPPLRLTGKPMPLGRSRRGQVDSFWCAVRAAIAANYLRGRIQTPPLGLTAFALGRLAISRQQVLKRDQRRIEIR